MILEKLKRKDISFSLKKRKSLNILLIMTENQAVYEFAVNYFAPYHVDIMKITYEEDSFEKLFDLHFQSKIYLITDSSVIHSDKELQTLLSITKGRAGTLLLGADSTLDTFWEKKHLGIDQYAEYPSESSSSYPYTVILEYFGFIKSNSGHRFLLIDTTQSQSMENLHFIYDEICTFSKSRPGAKSIIISFDVLNISLDAKIGKKTDSKIFNLLTSSDVIDSKVAKDYIIKITDNLSYFSIDFLGSGVMDSIEECMNALIKIINLIDEGFTYVYFYIPFYMTKFLFLNKLIKLADNINVITDSSLESVYMIKNLFEYELHDFSSKTQVLAIYHDSNKFKLDNASIYKKTGKRIKKKFKINRTKKMGFKLNISSGFIESIIKHDK